MSVSGVKLLCKTELGSDPGGAPVYVTTYQCSIPVVVPGGGLHYGNSVATPIAGLTESTFNLEVQQKVADLANMETSDIEAFQASDVYGGRI